MSFWKPKSKLAGRVFAILCLRPTIDNVESSHFEPMNGLVGHDHLDLPPPSRSPPISSDDSVHQAQNHQKYKTACSHWMFAICVLLFSGARNVTVNGGRFYAVGSNFVQRTGKQGVVISSKLWQMVPELHEIADMFADLVCVLGLRSPLPEALKHGQRETVAQTIDRRLRETIGHLQLPFIISTGFLYVIDAIGRHHTLMMDMAHSVEVCSYIKCGVICILHSFELAAI